MLDKMAFIGFASLYLLLNVVAVMGVTPDGPCSGKDLYSVLDLSREAKPREIKRAMVKLAKIWSVASSGCKILIIVVIILKAP